MAQNNQPPYGQAPYERNMPQQTYDPTSEVMSVGQYIGMIILSAIPVINIICWIVWLISPNTNKNKKNFIIAQIVIVVLGFVLSVVAGVFLIPAGYDLSQYTNF